VSPQRNSVTHVGRLTVVLFRYTTSINICYSWCKTSKLSRPPIDLKSIHHTYMNHKSFYTALSACLPLSMQPSSSAQPSQPTTTPRPLIALRCRNVAWQPAGLLYTFCGNGAGSFTHNEILRRISSGKSVPCPSRMATTTEPVTHYASPMMRGMRVNNAKHINDSRLLGM